MVASRPARIFWGPVEQNRVRAGSGEYKYQ
jgi:hypothetical protein